jgi:hypothetical protein
MMAPALHISTERINWLIFQASKDATDEDLNALEVVELRSIIDTADHGTGKAQQTAQDALEHLGLTAPSVVGAA